MLKGIAGFFKNSIEPAGDSGNDLDRRLSVATCALLLEAAHADDEFSDGERETIVRLVRERFRLDAEEAGRLIALAEEERRQSTDLYQFTRLINDTFDRARKLAVLEELWRVVYSDGSLEAHEDALMHKLANLLELKHRELIALKLRIKGADEG